jgi:hypothetical protein
MNKQEELKELREREKNQKELRYTLGRMFFIFLIFIGGISFSVVIRLLTKHDEWIMYLWGFPLCYLSQHIHRNLYRGDGR